MLVKSKIFTVCILFVSLLSINSVMAKDLKILPDPEKISKHVYAWIGPYGGPNVDNKGFRMNMAFVVGTKYVLVIDSGLYPKMGEAMISHIKKITSLPIKYVVNTDSQPHRYFGNDAFHNIGADIIAHEQEVMRMGENGNNYALMVESSLEFKVDSVKIPKDPNIVINKPMSIDLGGGVVAKIEMHKGGHTPAPLIVYIPVDNIVYAGDILYSGRLLAIVPGGNIKEWLETFEYMKKYKGAIFIPGHGQPAKLAEFKFSTYDYLLLLHKHMTRMVDEGTDMNDALLRLDQSKFSKLENYKALAGKNANRAYQEAESASFE